MLKKKSNLITYRKSMKMVESIAAGRFFIIFMVVATVCAAPRAKRETGCSAITIVSRESWGVSADPGGDRLSVPVSYVFIHHTDGTSCSDQKSCSNVVKGVYNHHTKTNKWSDIGYSFLIGGDGLVYEGRGWDTVGAHTYGWNSKAIGISFTGKYSGSVPSSRMQSAARNLILCGISKGKIESDYGLYGHRDGTCTSCPGDAFYNELKSWTNWHKHGTIKQHCSG